MAETSTARSAPVLDRAGYLRWLAPLLWPDPCETVIGGRVPGDGRVVIGRYLLIPHADRPRLLVPAGRRAGAAAVGGFNPARSPRARALSGVLSTALRGGAARLLRRRHLTVYAPREAEPATIETHLSRRLGTPVVIGLHIGPARANRKPVAQLLTPDGRIAGYAKIGVNELTGALVRDEAAALRRLADTALPGVRVPEVRYAGTWRDLEIVALSPLPVGGAHVPLTAKRVTATVAAIASATGRSTAPARTSRYRSELREQAARCADPRAAPILAALDELADHGEHGDAELPFGCWHGDLTRWNLAAGPDEVLVWDWERFATGVPVGFDALHFFVQDEVS